MTAEGAGDLPTLAALGVNTYVAPSACKEDGYKPDPLTFGDVFSEIGEAGAIFGVPERASALGAKQQAQLKAIALFGGYTFMAGLLLALPVAFLLLCLNLLVGMLARKGHSSSVAFRVVKEELAALGHEGESEWDVAGP